MPNPNLRLRPAGSGDRQFFFEVRRAAFRAYVDQLFGWDDDAQRIAADEEFDELPLEIVEDRGRDVGYLCVLHKKECDFIEEMALLPGAQGRGIGTQLICDIRDGARQRGVPVRLSVFANNPAQALYARLGFVVTSVQPPRVKMEWNQPRTK